MRYFIGDVRDGERLKEAMDGVDYVIHAAALKQVPAAEYNPFECIKTNIHGAQNVIQAALARNVEKVIALSTDKAANPVNLYGATKLASDKLFVAANNMVGSAHTGFPSCAMAMSWARAGRWCRSSQADRPGATELPITHPEHDALHDHAGSGRAIRAEELHPDARRRDFRAARSPRCGWSIWPPPWPRICRQKIVGIRPGEKLHEVMCPSDDSHLTLEFADHYVIKPSIRFHGQDMDYHINALGEEGKPVAQGFEYNSGSNVHFLNQDEIAAMNTADA
jgi:UDP-N-acetylglucosamine 4,6-dehydratase/5-epimerase